MHPPAFDDSGQCGFVDFDYDAVDLRLGLKEKDLTSNLSQVDFDRAALALRAIKEWEFQDGNRNPEGLLIRSIVGCWTFVPRLQHVQLTEVAQMFGKHKQSIGRWHDSFKERFPMARTRHWR